MPRKPVDRINPRLDTRDAIWAAIRRRRRFTTPELVGDTRLHRETVREYVRALAFAGYIEQVTPGDPPRTAAIHALIRDAAEAPRLRPDGSEVTQGRGRENMWRTMRILREFTVRELAVAASIEERAVAESEAQDYIRFLHKAGYLARIDGGGPGRPARYRFLTSRYTGPKSPMVQRVKQVFDPNLGRVVWPASKGCDDVA